MKLKTYKRCTTCRRRQPRGLFRRLKEARDGRGTQCLDCDVGRKYGHGDLRPVYDARRGLCGICDQPVAWRACVWDHVVPKSFDGPDTLENLQPAHESCNMLKKDFPLEIARKRIADRGHVATDVEADHEHEECDRCKRPFVCLGRHCRRRILCDACFDQAVATGRWVRGMSVDQLPPTPHEHSTPPSNWRFGRPKPAPDVQLTQLGTSDVHRACVSVPRAEVLRILNEEEAAHAPWMIAAGPFPCEDRPERLHYRVRPLERATGATP